MRNLTFLVERQTITQDPNCDFTNLVPGTEGYLQAEFIFSSEWDDCVKVVEFRNPNTNEEFEPQKLDKFGYCIIPSGASNSRSFKMRILGKRKGFKMTTGFITVVQNGR